MNEIELETEKTLENAKNEYKSNIKRIKEEVNCLKIEVANRFRRYKDSNILVMVCLVLYSSIITVCVSGNISLLGKDFINCFKLYFGWMQLLIEFGIMNLFRQQIDFNISSLLVCIYGVGSIMLILAMVIFLIMVTKLFLEIIKQPEWAIANAVSLAVVCSIGMELKTYSQLNLLIFNCILVIPIAILISKIYILPKTHIFSLIGNFIDNEITKKL